MNSMAKTERKKKGNYWRNDDEEIYKVTILFAFNSSASEIFSEIFFFYSFVDSFCSYIFYRLFRLLFHRLQLIPQIRSYLFFRYFVQVVSIYFFSFILFHFELATMRVNMQSLDSFIIFLTAALMVQFYLIYPIIWNEMDPRARG